MPIYPGIPPLLALDQTHQPIYLSILAPPHPTGPSNRTQYSTFSLFRSTSSDTASRGSETVELRPPSKTKPSRHKRLSNLFHRSVSSTGVGTAGAGGRWASEKKLSDLIDPVPEDLVELSSQRNLPGILKIFGGDISCGANYKSVLATPRSTAHQLVREALERYGVAPGDGEEDTVGGYMLCDVVGRFTGPGGAWQAEHLRPVGDTERPLVLQDVWKPKAGCSRRFEIRRRREVERAFEAEDNETAGEATPCHGAVALSPLGSTQSSVPLPDSHSPGLTQSPLPRTHIPGVTVVPAPTLSLSQTKL